MRENALQPTAPGTSLAKTALQENVLPPRGREKPIEGTGSSSVITAAAPSGKIILGKDKAQQQVLQERSGSLGLGVHSEGFRPAFSGQPTLLKQPRKRPAETDVYVDDEFRVPMEQSSTAQNSSLSSSSVTAALAAPVPEEVTRDRDLPPQVTPPRVAASLNVSRQVDMEEDSQDSDKENHTPITVLRNTPTADVVAPRGPRLSEASSISETPAEAQMRRVLQDLDLDQVPNVAQEHDFSEVEGSEEEDDDGQPESLAHMLEDRVRRNVDGRYDFDIYVDPENRS